MSTKTEATIEDLYKVRGKAEIANGEIILLPPTGDMPGYAGDEIFASLREHSRLTGGGRAPRVSWRRNAPTTSPRGRSSCGTLTSWATTW
jgi:hypothetical protein